MQEQVGPTEQCEQSLTLEEYERLHGHAPPGVLAGIGLLIRWAAERRAQRLAEAAVGQRKV